MNANQYVNKVVRRVQCGSAKKKEIKRQLQADIELRLEQGESLEAIMAQMGSAQEIAESFNENMSGAELKKFRQKRAVCILIPIALVFLAAAAYLFWMIPKSRDIDHSDFFDKAQVEAEMKRIVEIVDNEEYDALQAKATSLMQPYLSEKEMEKIKDSISEDWGSRQGFGTIYLSEVIQANEHYAVGELSVIYENVNVIYRLSLNEEMRLAGLYVR